MQLENEYKELIRSIYAKLKQQGFKKKGTVLYSELENTLLIGFQKSVKSNKEKIVFTINLGILSPLVLRYTSSRILTNKYEIEQCQLQERLGYLLPQKMDLWWEITTSTSTAELVSDLCDAIVKYALPYLDHYKSNISLRDLWLTGSSPGLTDIQRLINLSVLLKKLSPLEKFEEILKKAREATAGKPSSATFNYVLDKLNRE